MAFRCAENNWLVARSVPKYRTQNTRKMLKIRLSVKLHTDPSNLNKTVYDGGLLNELYWLRKRGIQNLVRFDVKPN